MHSFCSSSPPQHDQRGFTTIELMVVVGILATLAALAAPNFTPMIERYRVRQSVEELTSTFYFARSEAIKRGGGIAIAKTPNVPGVCSFATTPTDWGCGWVVFIDTNDDGVVNGAEQILQTAPPPANSKVVMPANTGSIRVNRWGNFTGIPPAGIFVFPGAKTSSDPSSFLVCVAASGKIKTIPASGTC